MAQTRKQEKSAAYMRRRYARNRAALVRERLIMGRDVETGMAYNELGQMVALKLQVEDVRFEAALRHKFEPVDAAFGECIQAILSSFHAGDTAEYRAELNALLKITHETRQAWRAAHEAQDMAVQP